MVYVSKYELVYGFAYNVAYYKQHQYYLFTVIHFINGKRACQIVTKFVSNVNICLNHINTGCILEVRALPFVSKRALLTIYFKKET